MSDSKDTSDRMVPRGTGETFPRNLLRRAGIIGGSSARMVPKGMVRGVLPELGHAVTGVFIHARGNDSGQSHWLPAQSLDQARYLAAATGRPCVRAWPGTAVSTYMVLTESGAILESGTVETETPWVILEADGKRIAYHLADFASSLPLLESEAA